MIHEFEYGLDEIESLIDTFFLPRLASIKIILFVGTLGSGKTTFIKRLIKKMGSNAVVTSPTFNYVNEYFLQDRVIQHFDLYRLSSMDAVEELGLLEMIEKKDTLSLIEWPEIIESYVRRVYANSAMKVELFYSAETDQVRQMKVHFL